MCAELLYAPEHSVILKCCELLACVHYTLSHVKLHEVPARLCCRLSHVVRIERVQNPHLWTKYCLRRHEVELAGSANEQLLFHGCSKDTLAIIGAEGFDIRVSAMSGSLGAGTYFAGETMACCYYYYHCYH